MFNSIKNKLNLLTLLKCFKFVTTLVLEFKKIQSDDKLLHNTFCSSSKAETFINESDIDDVFKSIYSNVISKIQKSLWQSSSWFIDSVIDYNINILKYNPLAGSSYIKLPKELYHPKKGLINIQNTGDNNCYKWCLVRYLHPADHNPRRITKADQDFVKKTWF